MGFFNNFPYTNFHDLNLNWILDKVNEWGKKVDELGKNFKDLRSMFHSLQDYVQSFFDSLVIKQAVAEKLEQMLHDGELDAILGQHVIRWGDLRQEVLNGRPIMRWRQAYETTAPKYDTEHGVILDNEVDATYSMQNGIIYSPSGDYSMNAPVKYIYFWETTSQDTKTRLRAYKTYTCDLEQELDTTPTLPDSDMCGGTAVLPNGFHGGSMVIKNGVLYAITERKTKTGAWNESTTVARYLYRFGLGNPEEPVEFDANGDKLSENITCSNLLGWLPYFDDEGNDTGHGVWLACTDKQYGSKKHNRVYEISEDFTTQVYKYTLENPTDIVTQDFKYDPERLVIYQTTSYPNEVIVYSAIDGHVITSIKYPTQHMSYVNAGEMEFTDIHGNYLYCGAMHVVGVSGDLTVEYDAWGINLNDLQSVRGIQNVVSGRRTAYVDGEEREPDWELNETTGKYENHGGIGKLAKFNVPYPALGSWNLHFAYAEDAFNYIREAQGGEVSFTVPYNYSFHVPYNCELRVGGLAGDIHPFKVDKDVVCNIRGLGLDFSQSTKRGTHALSRNGNIVNYNICFDVGSVVTMPALSSVDQPLRPSHGGTKALIADRCTIYTTATSFIEYALLANCNVFGTGHITRYVNITGGVINCRWFDIYYSSTHNVDTLAIIKCPLVCSTTSDSISPNLRPTIRELKAHNIPCQTIAFPHAGGVLSDFPIFTAAAVDGHTDVTWTRCTAPNNAGEVANVVQAYRYRVTHKRHANEAIGGFYGHYYIIENVPTEELPTNQINLDTAALDLLCTTFPYWKK